MNHRTLSIVAGVMLFSAIGWFAYTAWPRTEVNRQIYPTPEQTLASNCTVLKAMALSDLSEAIDDLERGKDDLFHEELFKVRILDAFTFCFPIDRDHPDDRPSNLIIAMPFRPTPQSLRWMRQIIEQGWAQSKVGEPWRGAVQ